MKDQIEERSSQLLRNLSSWKVLLGRFHLNDHTLIHERNLIRIQTGEWYCYRPIYRAHLRLSLQSNRRLPTQDTNTTSLLLLSSPVSHLSVKCNGRKLKGLFSRSLMVQKMYSHNRNRFCRFGNDYVEFFTGQKSIPDNKAIVKRSSTAFIFSLLICFPSFKSSN